MSGTMVDVSGRFDGRGVELVMGFLQEGLRTPVMAALGKREVRRPQQRLGLGLRSGHCVAVAGCRYCRCSGVVHNAQIVIVAMQRTKTRATDMPAISSFDRCWVEV